MTVPTPESLTETISSNLQALLGQRRGAQADMARRTGQSTVSVNRYVRGKVMAPLPFLVAVAREYQVSLDELCGLSRPEAIEGRAATHFVRQLYDALAVLNDQVKVVEVKQGKIFVSEPYDTK